MTWQHVRKSKVHCYSQAGPNVYSCHIHTYYTCYVGSISHPLKGEPILSHFFFPDGLIQSPFQSLLLLIYFHKRGKFWKFHWFAKWSRRICGYFDMLLHVVSINQLWICLRLRWYFTFYHGKSKSHHHLGNIFHFFQAPATKALLASCDEVGGSGRNHNKNHAWQR